MWLVATLFKSQFKRGGEIGSSSLEFLLFELSSDRLDQGGRGRGKKQTLMIISTFWNWTWNQFIAYGSAAGQPRNSSQPTWSHKVDVSLSSAGHKRYRLEVSSSSLWPGSVLSAHRQNSVWVTLPRPEPPSHRSLLWAQKQLQLVEIFGVGQRRAVSPVRQTLSRLPLGENSIFIKILTYIPFPLPNQKSTKTK